jgi:hypothetical protein
MGKFLPFEPLLEPWIIIILALQPFVGPWPVFQFLNLIQSRYLSLDVGSAGRKATTYTQNNTNVK